MLLTMGFLSNYRGLITANDINNKEYVETILEANKSFNLTHYMICTINRLRIDPKSIRNEPDSIFFTIMEQVDDFNWKEHTVRIPSNLGGYHTIMLVDGSEITLHVLQIDHKEIFANVLMFFEWIKLNKLFEFTGEKKMTDFLKFNIEYIGQTELTNNHIRFHQHKQISTILGDANAKRAHKEVWIILYSFQPPIVQSLATPKHIGEFRFDGLNGSLVKKLPKNEHKNLIEAVMIHYFQPRLNIHYKDNFPSDKHISYKYFYKQNISSVFVELHGNYCSYVIGSEKVGYKTNSYLMSYALSEEIDGVYILDNNEQNIDFFLQLEE